MFKRILATLFILITTHPVFAGQFDNAINGSKPVFLYVYAPWCGSCKMFNPIYENLIKNYSNKYSFVKLNVETSEGEILSRRYKIRYIPFVAIFKPKATNGNQVQFACAMNNNCINKVLGDFAK